MRVVATLALSLEMTLSNSSTAGPPRSTLRSRPTQFSMPGATAMFRRQPKLILNSGTMAPGQYFLVQLSGGATGDSLPTPDANGSIAMAATAGKVALVSGTTALTGSGCPFALSVADVVGYGTTADCFEGAGRAPAPSNTTADFRRAGGCSDTDNNAADFFVSAPSAASTRVRYSIVVYPGPAPSLFNQRRHHRGRQTQGQASLRSRSVFRSRPIG
jgi:hypothetical protein